VRKRTGGLNLFYLGEGKRRIILNKEGNRCHNCSQPRLRDSFEATEGSRPGFVDSPDSRVKLAL